MYSISSSSTLDNLEEKTSESDNEEINEKYHGETDEKLNEKLSENLHDKSSEKLNDFFNDSLKAKSNEKVHQEIDYHNNESLCLNNAKKVIHSNDPAHNSSDFEKQSHLNELNVSIKREIGSPSYMSEKVKYGTVSGVKPVPQKIDQKDAQSDTPPKKNDALDHLMSQMEHTTSSSPPVPHHTVFIQNISPEVTDTDLKQTFLFAGSIKQTMIRTKNNQRTALVEFMSLHSVRYALKANGKVLINRKIRVKKYVLRSGHRPNA